MLSKLSVLLALAWTPNAASNCFVMLDKPTQTFSEDEIKQLIRHFKANLNINGTGAVLASPGETPALTHVNPNMTKKGYRYHWMRDAALSMKLFMQLDEFTHFLGNVAVSKEFVEETTTAWSDWIAGLHRKGQNLTTIENSTKTDPDYAEPKWSIDDAEPYADSWCRPQTDGPALRARTLLYAAENWKSKRKHFWELAKKDLDWLAKGDGFHGENIDRKSCDAWEETWSTDFLWNKVVMHAALREGAHFAEVMKDIPRSMAYKEAAMIYIGDPYKNHIAASKRGGYATECPVKDSGWSCQHYRKEIDGIVILSLIHGRMSLRDRIDGMKDSILPKASSQLAASTVKAYNGLFCDLYPINQDDTTNGIPGVLYGRYARDTYGGASNVGNPWLLVTAALASLFYQAAQEVADGRLLSSYEYLAWEEALNYPPTRIFEGTAEEFIAAGDSVLQRLRHHIAAEDNMELYEQIDGKTGHQYNARGLSWSYSEVLAALVERTRALGLADGLEWKTFSDFQI
eukprot:TRINITY_DN30087_c2_g1_i1.p1 TRINITY_DN30087_c2_g1~~TRINITY_DN30087_c2_g1_i1.p1  ORF type:complete len:515 (+),score=84.50 TRINITY_DN30087_c2_g1_i1:100-1644(+)